MIRYLNRLSLFHALTMCPLKFTAYPNPGLVSSYSPEPWERKIPVCVIAMFESRSVRVYVLGCAFGELPLLPVNLSFLRSDSSSVSMLITGWLRLLLTIITRFKVLDLPLSYWTVHEDAPNQAMTSKPLKRHIHDTCVGQFILLTVKSRYWII